MNEVYIQEAQPEHADEIWKIIQTSFVGAHSRYVATGQAGYRIYLEERLRAKRSNTKILVIARIDKHVAAFADVTLNHEGANFLTRIAVAQEFRGKGVVRQMMRRIDEVYKSDCHWELDVLSTNTGAIKMYESLGFKTVSNRKWVGRLLPQRVSHQRSHDRVESEDVNYARYGFTNTWLQNRSISIAGTAVRCYDTSSFLDDVFLNQVQEKYPKIDRAFIILDVANKELYSCAEAFEIVRSHRMVGSF